MVFEALFPAVAVGAVRFVLATLMVVSGFLKLEDLRGFADIVQRYNVMPRRLARFSAYIHPFAELVIGGVLFSGSQVVLGATLSLLNLGGATFFLVYALARKIKLDNCGCYGTAVKVPVSWRKVLENVFWLVLSLYLLAGALLA